MREFERIKIKERMGCEGYSSRDSFRPKKTAIANHYVRKYYTVRTEAVQRVAFSIMSSDFPIVFRQGDMYQSSPRFRNFRRRGPCWRARGGGGAFICGTGLNCPVFFVATQCLIVRTICIK